MNRARLAGAAKHCILIIGDSQADADSLASTVSAQIGIDVDIYKVTELSTLERALLARSWDVVLCPIALTRLAPVAAVQWITSAQPKSALILVAATVPAQDAIDLMRLGACGFVETGDPRRLAEVIRRELMTSSARTPDHHAQDVSERYRQALLAALPDHIITIALDGTIVDLQGPADRLPYPPASLIGHTLPELMPARLAQRSMEAIARVITTHKLVTFQYTLPIQKGMHAFEVRIVPLGGDQVLAIVREVTDRKRIEVALRTSEELYHTLLESSDAAISMVDRDGGYLYLNGIAARQYGVLPDELLGKKVGDLFSPAETTTILADVNRVIDQRRGIVLETKVSIAGRLRWFRSSIQPVNDASGWPYAALIVANEITDLKEAELALRASELRYRSIVEDQTEMVCRYDPDLRLTFANGAYCRAFDLPLEALLGQSVLDRIADEEREQVQADLRCLSVENPVSISLQREATSRRGMRWFEWKNRAIFDDQGRLVEYQGVGRDITEQRLAEEALVASEEKYRSLVESSDSVIAMFAPDGALLFGNALAARDFGLTSEQFAGKRMEELFPPDVAARQLAAVRTVIETGVGQVGESSSTVMGEERWYRTSIQPVRDGAGNITAATVNATDITASRAAVAALHHSEARFQLFMRYLPGAVFLKDGQGRTLFCNDRYASLCDRTPEELVGKLSSEYLPAEIAAPFMRENEQVLAEGRARELAHTFPGADGPSHWFTVKFPIPRENEPPFLGAISLDVTKEKQAEAALQAAHDLLEQRVTERTAELERTKDRLEAIFDHSGDGILLLNLTRGIQQTNFAFDMMFGMTPGDAHGRRLTEYVQPGDADTIAAILQEVAASHETRRVEVQARRVDGTGFDVEISVAPVNRSADRVSNLVCIFRDVGVRKQAERAMAEERNLLRTVIDALPDFIYVKDMQHRMVLNNLAHAHSVGCNVPSELVGKTDFDLFPPEMAAAFHADEAQLLASGRPVVNREERSLGEDGSEIWAQTTKLPLRNTQGEVVGLVGITHDVTEIRAGEAALELRRCEEHEMQGYLKALHTISLQMAHTETLDAFYRCVVELGLTHFAFDRMGLLLRDGDDGSAMGTYGTNAKGEVVDEHHLRLDPASLTGILKRPLNRKERFALEADAEIFDDLAPIGRGENVVAALWSDDQVLGWLAVDNGVRQLPLTKAQLDLLPLYALTTSSLLARKRAEFALRESEERFRQLIESAPIATLIADQQGTLVLVNRAAEQIFGYDRAELVGQSVEVLVPIDRMDVHSAYRMRYMTAPAHRRQQAMELQARRKDGTLFPAEINLSLVDMQPSPLVMSFVNNITARRQAEQTLRQSLAQEKELGELKSRLVAVFSHDFRNPLMTILASSNLIRMLGERLSPEKLEQQLNRIDGATHLLVQMLDDMLTLAAMESGQFEFMPQPLDMASLVKGILEEFRAVDQGAHTLTLQSSLLHAVQADLKLLRQIVTNLVSNAIKYSPPGSEVTVTLAERGSSVVLLVQDQGIGIPEESRARLFEPFHRAANARSVKGTGLGLSIVKGSVEHHHGRIAVESTLGQGTTFTVELPQGAE